MPMNNDSIIEELRNLNYTGKVDVVDQVMSQVANKPLLVGQQPQKQRIRRYIYAAAACLLLVAGVSVALKYTNNYHDNQIGSMLAEVYDYHYDYGTFADDEYVEFAVAECLLNE